MRRWWTSPCSAAACGPWGTGSPCPCTWTGRWWRRRSAPTAPPTNPLSGLYRTADERYLALVMMQPGKFWADVCRHIDRPELAEDPRFASGADLAANTDEAVKILREVIAVLTLGEWTERFTTLAGPWAAGRGGDVTPAGERPLTTGRPLQAYGWAHFGVQVSRSDRMVPRWVRSAVRAGCGLSARQISEWG